MRSTIFPRIYRIIGEQGYQAPLSDLLTASLGEPIIIFNEGIGGDDSFNLANQRLDSILARHPEAKYVLVMIGTNDAWSLLPTPRTVFKQNLQIIANKIAAAGATPIVALVPPNFSGTSPLTSSTNAIIQDYNNVVKSEISGIQTGPDLFSYFLSSSVNFSSLFR